MANSYGVNEVPDAVYGEYDSENGEWTGTWFFDQESAADAAAELDEDGPLGIVSTSDEEDWL